MDCIFCKIISGEIPSKTLYETEELIVIMDASPVSNGHVLVIPKKHYTTFEDLDNDILMKINETAKMINKHLIKSLNADGMTILVNYGIKQMVKHYHLHLIPAYKEDYGIEDLDKVFQKIKDI